MELIHSFLNLVAPPFTFFSLCLLLPPYWASKFFLSTLGCIFSQSLAGKVVLISGASSGIGEHLAYEYAKRGARLALGARRENSLQEVADRARNYGSPDVIVVRSDVSKVEDCRRLVEETVNRFGRLDHLVNNAGITAVSLIEDTPDITNFRPIMETNFWGSVYATRFALPHLRDTKGTIIVMSSSEAWLPLPRTSVYSASKAAMLTFFETLRVEMGSDIQITMVTPGFIESEITQGKFLLSEGKMNEGRIVADHELRDAQIGPVPVGGVRGCAKAIVDSAVRGDRCLTVPSWFRMTYLWKVFFPELLEWGYRLVYLNNPAKEAPSKRILDASGVKNVVYPSTIQSPQVKSD